MMKGKEIQQRPLYLTSHLWWKCSVSPPGSPVHAILQARIPEWVAISYSRGSSWRRDRTCVFCVSCIGKWVLYHCCSVTQLCPTLCDPMDCSTPGLPILHHLLEFIQTYVHWVSDAIQSSHPLSSPSPLAPPGNPSVMEESWIFLCLWFQVWSSWERCLI